MHKFIIEIEIKSNKWRNLKNIISFVKKTSQKIISKTEISFFLHQKSVAHLSILLVSNPQIRKINQQFRGIDKPTDILSFCALDEQVIHKSGLEKAIFSKDFVPLGDLVIAFEMVEKDANLQNKGFYPHLTHLLTHGILHLIGYDHEENEMAELMEKKEIEILRHFQIENPY